MLQCVNREAGLLFLSGTSRFNRESRLGKHVQPGMSVKSGNLTSQNSDTEVQGRGQGSGVRVVGLGVEVGSPTTNGSSYCFILFGLNGRIPTVV